MPLDTTPDARTLPDGKPISALGFGCSSRWSQPSFPVELAAAMLEAAVANGINHFDTAPSYADGEARLGAFLRGRDPADFIISTKVGTEAQTHRRSFDPESMRSSFEGSLDRLGLRRVDILYLHGPSVTDLNHDVFAFFDDMKAAGRIGYCGVNSFDPAVVAACLDHPVDAVMLQYNLSDRRFDTLIEALAANSRIVIAGTILAQGTFDLKTFVPRNRTNLWYLLRALKNDPLFFIRASSTARRIARTGLDPHEAAVRFAISNPGLTSCLFGTSSTAHLIANAKSGERKLAPDVIDQLLGLAE